MDEFEKLRKQMVEYQLKTRGISDERVLAAMKEVQRHLFVDEYLQDKSYDDCALPLGEGQTISQPYMVALMTQLLELKGNEKVLEIGTGSGYQSAVLSLLADDIYTVERIPYLAERASALLEKLEYRNIHVIVSDGTLGLPEYAPFDAIIVTAGSPDIPKQYIDQLKINGHLVIPVGSRYSQTLYHVIKKPDNIETKFSTACVFVPLIGKDGWTEGSS